MILAKLVKARPGTLAKSTRLGQKLLAQKIAVIKTLGASGMEGGETSGESDGQPKPAGLIKSLEANGFEAAEGGGWKARVDHAPSESADEWKAKIPGWKSQVVDISQESQDIACIDASKRIFQAIEELEKPIGEGVPTIHLEKSAELIEASVQEVSARSAEGLTVTTSVKENRGKKAKGGIGETTKKAKNNCSHPRRKGWAKGRCALPSTLHQVWGRLGLARGRGS